MRLSFFALVCACGMSLAAAQPLGMKPEYLQETATGFANEAAIGRRIWMPGLDQGYVPQGLAVVGRHVLISAYQSADPKIDRGPCRIFRVEIETGKAAGHFDMPPGCFHSGAVVDVGNAMVVVVETEQLWRIDLEKALAAGKAEGAIRGTVLLGAGLRGSFGAFDGTDLWIGTYTLTADEANAKIQRLPLRVFDEFDGRTVGIEQVAETVKVPRWGQGLAFENKDIVWMAASTRNIGRLHRIDRRTGAVLAAYETVGGLEGIDFDAERRLWAVSEAGAKRYLHWPRHFPFIFTIDVAKLK
jgi:hypothetical protein